MVMQAIVDDSTGRCLEYTDTVTIPIIENTCREADLRHAMCAAMMAHPRACAVLVRRHGIYVWGATWQRAKTIAESLDYLFQVALLMRQCGLDPNATP